MKPSLPPDPPPDQDRRGFPRYFPRALVPLLFAHRDAETPTAGHIGDVSRSGVRIVAPPMARPFLHWPDALSNTDGDYTSILPLSSSEIAGLEPPAPVAAAATPTA